MSSCVIDIINDLIIKGENFTEEDRINQIPEYHDWYFQCVSFVKGYYGKYDKGVKTKEYHAIIDKTELDEIQKKNLKDAFELLKTELQAPVHDESKIKIIVKGIIDYGLKFTPIVLKLIEMYYK